ncbi:MAG: tetratricopeptide repeat protein [Pseudonocardiaceae bacterium]
MRLSRFLPLPAAHRRLAALVALGIGAVLLILTAFGLARGDDAVAQPIDAPSDPLSRSIAAAQKRLLDNPGDAVTLAALGSAYVERARVTADPSYYQRAQAALDRSMAVQPGGNAGALIGLGSLANARHDFAAARDLAQRARDLQPATAAGYGVLADALTQLGDAPGASAAIQRMLDLRPGIASFTRASYDFELHGRVDDARYALEQALADSTGPETIAFCRYYLGELAFNAGDLDAAAAQYERGLVAAPKDVALRQGRAKVAVARGDLDQALLDYAKVTNRVPLPQYVQEYGELLESAGRIDAAKRQYTLFTQQQRLYESAGSVDDLAVAQFAADHGDPAEALRRAEAEWQRRQSVLVADAMAWALHVNGRDAEALTFADRAGALGGRNATVAYHRGMILASLGRRTQAQQQLAGALAINPYFSVLQAPRARAALAGLTGAE